MPNTATPIRFLHLSDFHFRAGKAWDQDPVLRALARSIADEVRQGLIPDFVAITGDIAHAGLADEYALAKDWLEKQLWPALPKDFPRDRLLLVPGNHDVDRRQIKQGARLIQEGLLDGKSQDAIAELLQDVDERDILLKRHAAYLAFVSDWLGQSQTLPWWQRDIRLGASRLHIAGLDSAWVACGDQDRDHLLLGRFQLSQTVDTQQAQGADWRIALLHHPFDYLAEFDGLESRRSIHQHCELLLRGHLHEAEAYRVVPPDPARACLELAAGCVYEGSAYPNAYQWIELYAEPRRVKVLFRAWIKGVWGVDRNQPGCPEGFAEFGLEGHSSNPPPPVASPNPSGPGGVSVQGNNYGTINTGIQINTNGGAFVGGNVSVKGGNFVGRDFIQTINQVTHVEKTVPNQNVPHIIDKWVNMRYPEQIGITEELKALGFKLRWVSANNESELIDVKGWEPVLVEQADGSKARLKVRDNPAIGGYLILLKKLDRP